MKKLKLGILSTANIAINTLIPAIKKSQNCEVSAIASRTIEKAKKVAEMLEIPSYYGNYEDLLNDKEIDAIYIPLPNHLHIDWAIKSMQSGKHVLCEKPISVNIEDGERIKKTLDSYPNLLFMEAFMYGFHKQWNKVKEIIRSGKIGKIIDIKSTFSYNNPDPKNIRNKYKNGGGGLLDVGCYCINLSRMIYNEEPNRVISSIDFDKNFEVDTYAKVFMEFPSGHASFSVGTKTVDYQQAIIVGTQGMITIENPFYPTSSDGSVKIHIKTSISNESFTIASENQYSIMVDHFAESIFNKTQPKISFQNSLDNMKIIDKIFESAKIDIWVENR